MNKSENIDQLAAALVAFQGDLVPVAKDSENPFFRSSYASLASIWRVLQPILQKHGLAVVQIGAPTGMENSLTLETMIIHTSGQWISGEITAPLSKADPQGTGSAITYIRRYGLTAALGVVYDEDDDGNKATQNFQRPQAVPAQAPTSFAQLDQQAAAAQTSAGPKASAGQIGLLKNMCKERDQDPEIFCLAQVDTMPDELTVAQASQLIDVLKTIPKAQAAVAAAGTPAMTGDAPATVNQINAIGKIAESCGVAVSSLIEQEYQGVSQPNQLSKSQASHIIKTYGAGGSR